MIQDYYFQDDSGAVGTGSAQWQQVPEPDPENPHLFDPLKQEIDEKWIMLAGISDGLGAWRGVYTMPELVLTKGGKDYTEAEFAAAYSVTEIDEDTGVEAARSIAQPDAVNLARNEDGSLADGVVSSTYYQGPAAWTPREGVTEITQKEYLSAISGKTEANKK